MTFPAKQKYRGPWAALGLEKPESLWRELEAGFKIAGARNLTEFPHMDGKLCGIWKDPEGRSQTIMLQFLDSVRGFPSMQVFLVRGSVTESPSTTRIQSYRERS